MYSADNSSSQGLYLPRGIMDEEELDSSHSQMDEISLSKRPKIDGTDPDRLLNFATAADEFELSLKRHKIPRNPMSHRIIEKRRRDRMNNCLADLSRLIPPSYHKQGQGRIEKTEIIEMAIKHINLLQEKVDQAAGQSGGSEPSESSPIEPSPTPVPPTPRDCCGVKFYLGFKEAQDEVMRFLVEVESVSVVDPFCKKIMKHLENASKKFTVESKCDTEANESISSEADVGSQSALFQHSSSFYPPSSNGTSSVGGDRGSNYNQNNSNSNSDASSGGMPMFSYSLTNMGGATDSSAVGSSGYVSDLSTMGKSSRENVYKFKHNITKRFSQEGHHHRRSSHHHHHHHHHQPSDTSSNTSSRDFEDDQGQFKWRVKHKSQRDQSYQDEGEALAGSSASNLDDNSSCTHSNEATRRKRSSSSKSTKVPQSGESSPSSSVALPGFILHPTGTHYMPISVHNSNISEMFESPSDQEGLPVFHPISIPVHFRRPVIAMPDITICTHISSQQRGERHKKE